MTNAPLAKVANTMRTAQPWVLVVFLAIVFLLGGGARADITSLAILRPLTALVFVYAVAQFWARRPTDVAIPIALMAGWVAMIALQLVPLPPAWWTSLPGREPIVAAFSAAGIEYGWRPISVFPSATLNSLQAMFVPLAVLLLFGTAAREYRRYALVAIAVYALASVSLGVLQVIGGENSILYPYRISNAGEPIGLLANRNHQAALMAATIPVLLALSAQVNSKDRRLAIRMAAYFVVALMVMLAILSGSRTGTVLAIFSLLAGLYLIVMRQRPATDAPVWRLPRWLRIGLPVTVVLLGVLLLYAAAEGTAFERFSERSNIEDLRVKILPQLIEMVRSTLPFGFGFGTFPEAFEIYERTEQMAPRYVNHAHNDWLEIVIEGGIPAIIIAASFAVWILLRTFSLREKLVRPVSDWDYLRLAALLGILVLVAASLLDYPLRTPALAAVMAVLLGVFGTPSLGNVPSNK